MAAFDIITWDSTNNRSKRKTSNTTVWDFQSIRIGTDNLTIAEASASAFDFGNKKISNVTDPTLAQDVATKAYVDANSGGTGNLKADGSVAMTGNLNANSNKIVSLANPTSAQDAATKAYVDAVATGLTPKASVKVATTAALPSNLYANGTAGVGATLTGSANGALAAIDGYTPVLGDRILVKNEASTQSNGIYTVTQVGDGSNPYVLTRTTDADTCQPASNPKVISGIHTFVQAGTANAGTGWVLTTNDPITLGSTGLTFSQFSALPAYTAGNGIQISGNAISARIDGNSLQFSSGVITLTLNGATLNASASGLKVADAGITATQLASSVAGNGLTGGAGTALSVVAANSTISVGASGVSVNNTLSLQNDNAGSITVGQIVYIKTNGRVDLASKTVASNLVDLGIVSASSIATGASGAVVVGTGAQISGFTGLTPGAPVYVGATAGAVTQTTAGFTAGDFLYRVGYALNATTIVFEPEFLLEW